MVGQNEGIFPRRLLENRGVLLLSLLLLCLAHALALLFRIQPAVSLWFPPSGVAIFLTLWLGPVGAVLTWIATFLVSPFWENGGWSRLVSITDAAEPLVAWFLYCRCFKGSLSLGTLRSTVALIISAPIAACGTSAILGSLMLVAFGKMSAAELSQSIPHWWLGNALGTMTIVPLAMLFISSHWAQGRWIRVDALSNPAPTTVLRAEDPLPDLASIATTHKTADFNRSEMGLIAASIVLLAFLTVHATKISLFTALQLSWLSFVPIVWTAIRYGVRGGVVAASFSVFITLIDYLWLYPHAILLPRFPIDPELLHVHKLSLLLQCAIALLIGTAMTERAATHLALAIEQLRLAEYRARAQLSEELLQLNHSLSETNQQLQDSEARFRTSVENMLDCFGVYSAIRDEQGKILDFRIDYVNEAACVNNQMSREAQMGRGLCEILPNHRADGIFEEYCQVVETGQSLVKDALVYGDQYGQSCLIRAFDIRIAKCGDGFVATWRDVTARRQTEEALRQRQQEFEALVNNSPDVITRLDRQLRYVYVNPVHEKVTGYRPEYFLGKTIDEVWQHQGPLAQLRVDLQFVLQTGEIKTDEFSLPTLDGTPRFYHTQFVPERTQDGSVGSILLLTRDITHLKQIETALRQSEAIAQARAEELETFMETVPAAVWMAHDPHCHKMTANRAAHQLLRIPEGAIATATPETGDYPFAFKMQREGQILPLEELPMQKAGLTGQEVETTLEFVFEDEVRSIYGKAVPLYNEAGAVRGVIGAFLDVTDRQRSEEALRQKQEWLDLAQAAAKVGSFEWTIPTNVNVWSKELEALYGLEPGEFEGTYEAWAKRVHPEDLVQAETQLLNALKTGEFSTDWRVIWQDGSVHWLHSRARVFFDEQGQPMRMVGVNTDITDRKQTEEALRQSELLFRTLADAMPQMFWITRSDGFHEYFNQRWYDYTGENLEQTQGEGWQKILHPDDVERTIEIWQTSLHTGKNYEIEYRLRRALDGEYRWHLGRAFPLHDSTGKILKWFGSCTDIHDQKLAIEERAQALEQERAARLELERASRMKDEFLAIVSHELRSPLNGILGWARLLRTRRLDATKMEQALASIERNAQAQTQLIEDLLDISRIIRGVIRLNLRPTHLMPVIQAALDTIQPAATVKSIQIKFWFSGTADLVYGDPERLQQVVWNLLSNAVKFTPEHGRVEVRLQQDQSHLRIAVIDSGKGIRPDFLPYVFDRFRQADATTTRTQGGLGLGLAIVRNLVELHGGTVQVNSAGVNQGSTFEVCLALLSGASSLPQDSDSLAGLELPDSLAGLRVLVVDDEPDTREFLSIALEQFGAVVESAASASEALTCFLNHPPDVLLSDIGMPGEDGYSLIRKIRSLPLEAGGQVPAAALTAYVRGDDRLQALTAGFQQHVAKPIEPLQLLRVVTQLAKRSTQ